MERGSGKERKWVYRVPHEKREKEMIQPYPKGKGVSVMVWGAFVGKEQSNLICMTRDSDAKRNSYTAMSSRRRTPHNVGTRTVIYAG